MDGEDLRNRFRTDYTGSLARAQPVPAPPPLPDTEPVRKSRSKKIVIIPLFLLMVGGSLAGWWLTRSQDPIPSQVKSSVKLPLYYPSVLPDGYKVEQNSYQSTGEIVSFHAVNPKGDKLLFSIQPRPATFDFQAFYQKGLTGTEQFSTPVGQAGLGRAQTKLIGNLVTETSWIIVSSSNQQTPAEDIRLILNNIKRSS